MKKVVQKKKRFFALFFVSDVLLMVAVALLNLSIDGAYILYLNVVPFALFFVIVGHFLSLFFEKIHSKLVLLMVAVLAIAITAIASFFNDPVLMYSNHYGKYYLFFITSLFGSIGVVSLSKLTTFAILEWAGKHSLIIYTFQFHIIMIIPQITIQAFHAINLYNKYLIFSTYSFFCIILIFLFSIFASKKLGFLFGENKK